MENPFITSFHWESNVRRALDYIQENALRICDTNNFKLYIMAHSDGASVVARIAWEYPFITRILLTNPAVDLEFDEIISGLHDFTGNATILIGSKDDSVKKLEAQADEPDCESRSDLLKVTSLLQEVLIRIHGHDTYTGEFFSRD